MCLQGYRNVLPSSNLVQGRGKVLGSSVWQYALSSFSHVWWREITLCFNFCSPILGGISEGSPGSCYGTCCFGWLGIPCHQALASVPEILWFLLLPIGRCVLATVALLPRGLHKTFYCPESHKNSQSSWCERQLTAERKLASGSVWTHHAFCEGGKELDRTFLQRLLRLLNGASPHSKTDMIPHSLPSWTEGTK